MCTVPIANRFCRESYNDPEAVYRRLKTLGMDLVTITDHDSIDAAEDLRHHPDFFLSEEVTCRMPSGNEAHVGVYGIDERDHVELQRRRDDLLSLLSYLHEQRLLFSINHVFSSLTGRRDSSDFEWFERGFPCAEVQNGAMPASVNRSAAEWARATAKAVIGGSDAHTIRSIGSAYTIVPGATDAQEFLCGIRLGRSHVEGSDGNWWTLTQDVLAICGQLFQEKAWTRACIPLALAIPAVTAVHIAKEAAFAGYWHARVAGATKNSAKHEALHTSI